jgi:hypothetical protein
VRARHYGPAAASARTTVGTRRVRADHALGVLGTDVTCVIAAGTLTLVAQRGWQDRHRAARRPARAA